ncbi:MAG: hypothetical protein KJ556_21320 [Gammaproteobacteria bacterium]|nr:hypothetical protein [Gammaproteobacteria bacterium]
MMPMKRSRSIERGLCIGGEDWGRGARIDIELTHDTKRFFESMKKAIETAARFADKIKEYSDEVIASKPHNNTGENAVCATAGEDGKYMEESQGGDRNVQAMSGK